MTELSPAAQAVLDAVCANTEPDCDTQHIIAAALRALADQVVPETTTPWNSTLTPVISAKDVRSKILAIAAELEGDNEPTFTPEEIEMIQAPWSYLQSQQELEGGND